MFTQNHHGRFWTFPIIEILSKASAEACAEYCVSLFSDYTRMVTMQNLFHDGGFSFTGISNDLMDGFRNAAAE
jgi:hypothetical protein